MTTNLLDLNNYKTPEEILKEQDYEKRKWKFYKSAGRKPTKKFLRKLGNIRYERARLYRK